MTTLHAIAAEIVRTGVLRGFHVVPEFPLLVDLQGNTKRIDLTWFSTLPSARLDNARQQRCIRALFEIEGYDVPVARIRQHAIQIGATPHRAALAEDARCYIVLYNEAHHRKTEKWGSANPEKAISRRVAEAHRAGGLVEVRDGRDLRWLAEI